MKILQVLPTLDPAYGGPVEGAIQQGKQLFLAGHSIHVASFDPPDFVLDSRVVAESVFLLGPSRLKYAYCGGFANWLRSHIEDYDVIVIHGIWQFHSYCVRRIAMEFGVPYVVFCHGMLDPWFRIRYPLKHLKKWVYWLWREYKVLRDAQFVLFTTNEELKLARQSFWLYRVRERLVGYGICDRAIPLMSARSLFLERFPELENGRIILYLSRIHPKKGCDMLIRAFSKVASSDLSLRLVIAGPDDLEFGLKIRSEVRKLGIADRVTFTGMLKDELKWGAYDAADVFVLPSHQENFGIVVAEALSSGLPVLTTNKVNIWREIVEWGAGIVHADTQEGADLLLTDWLALSALQKQTMRQQTRPCFLANFEIGLVGSALEGALLEASSEALLKFTFSRRSPRFASRRVP